MEQIRSADVLANFPQVDEEKLNAAKHQFRRAATQINHQIRSFDVATNHARGTKEA